MLLILAASGTGHTQGRPQWNKEVLQDDTESPLYKRSVSASRVESKGAVFFKLKK